MKVLIQWATSNPGDWDTYDINSVRDVRRLPRKPPPVGGENLDGNAGWVAGINIQGVVFTGYDHIGFEMVNGVLIVKCWNDGSDFAVGERWGQVWQFPAPFFDERFGQMNVEQTVTWYGESQSTPVLLGVQGVRPWAEFVPAPNNQTIHGVWMSDALWAEHQARQSTRGWREWVA